MMGHKIAVLGHGIVGSGVCEILCQKSQDIEKACGKRLELGYVIDLKNFENLSYSDKFVKDYSTVLDDDSVGVVVEAIGGTDFAYSYVKSALEHRKSVVTSNKELIAEKGAELLKIACAHNVNLLFEASVGGGIPIIRPLYSSVSAYGIEEISGILNGTTNYILTQMHDFGLSYESALSDAQSLGYAESDPSADILGFDSKRKLAILSSLCWGKSINPKEIFTEGIEKIKKEDMDFADKNGFVIRLIAKARRIGTEKIFAVVCPMLVEKNFPFANVSGVFNAVLVKTETAGELIFYGKGAGKFPTASAVVSDIIECIKSENNIGSVFWEDGAQNSVIDCECCAQKYCVRYDGDFGDDLFEEELKYIENFDLESGFITKPLMQREFFALKERLDLKVKTLSVFPIFE